MMHGVVTAVEEDMQEVRQTRCWQDHQLTADSGDLAEAWVNILPKNPYLAKRGVLEKLILLKSKKDDFREN